MIRALIREISPALGHCELTFLDRQPIDLDRARGEHQAYRAALEGAGARVDCLPAAPDCPDGCFVEDPAVVVDEVAVIARPGTPTRRAEVAAVEAWLAQRRPLRRIEAPATLEGGDVLRVGRTVYAGLSSRTNAAGVAALGAALSPFGYRVMPVPVHGSLHLKTACTALDETTLLLNSDWLDASAFAGVELVPLPPDEPWAANTLRVGGRLFLAAGFPRTLELLLRRGYAVEALEIGELRKAEAGLTCLSLLLEES